MNSRDVDTRSGAVNGARSDQSNLTLDGVDVNDQVNGNAFTSVLPVSVDSVQEFAIQVVMATQPEHSEAHELARKYIRYGSSPRGAQALVECGRVRALMHGRYHLSVEDIDAVAASVLRHRIILNFDAHADGQTPDTILSTIIREAAAHASAA